MFFGKKNTRNEKKLGRKNIGYKKLGQKNVNKSTKKRPVDDLNDDEKLDAILANDAYKSKEDRKNVGDYEYLKEDSDKHTGVYINRKTGKVRIGIRGTADMRDVGTDAYVTAGKLRSSKRFKEEEKKYDKVAKRYGKENIEKISGHSLGGSLSYELSKKKGVKATLFNAGRGLDSSAVLDKARCNNPVKRLRPKFCDDIKQHRIVGDAISTANRLSGGKTKTHSIGSMNPLKKHSMSNFVEE